MRISDWSSDVCPSDLAVQVVGPLASVGGLHHRRDEVVAHHVLVLADHIEAHDSSSVPSATSVAAVSSPASAPSTSSSSSAGSSSRSEEHTSELQSLMRISYAVFCLKKKHTNQTN